MTSKRFLITMSADEADRCRRALQPRERFAQFVSFAAIKEADFRLNKTGHKPQQSFTSNSRQSEPRDQRGPWLDRSDSQE